MSNFSKAIASFLILIIISISLYFVIYQGNFDIKAIKFINSNLEMRYTNELNTVSSTLADFLSKKTLRINEYLAGFDYNKYFNRVQIRQVSVENENRLSERIFQDDPHLKKVKFITNSGEVLYSTDKSEIISIKQGNNILFSSSDGIEKNKEIFNFSTEKETFIRVDNDVVLKRNVVFNEKNSGVILFYYNKGFVNDCFRNIDTFSFYDSTFIDGSIVILNKPSIIPDTELNSAIFNENNEISFLIKDIEKNSEIEQKFRVLKSSVNGFDLSVISLHDIALFNLDKKKSMILMYLLVFSVYLLILMVLLSGKSEIIKARERLSLFTATLLEEFINAKTKEDIEAIRNSLGDKKKTILKGLYINFKKLKPNDKKNIEDELDSVLLKIEDSFKKRIKPEYDGDNIVRIEKLFERFIETIAEKGINITGEVRQATGHKKSVKEELDEVEDAEDLE
ncbi:MAG TPA: hypothetical protein DDY71_07620, partial [Spirochaetia bacterium]|nr:hypothetical protein [Spirochaetia bacterium]